MEKFEISVSKNGFKNLKDGLAKNGIVFVDKSIDSFSYSDFKKNNKDVIIRFLSKEFNIDKIRMDLLDILYNLYINDATYTFNDFKSYFVKYNNNDKKVLITNNGYIYVNENDNIILTSGIFNNINNKPINFARDFVSHYKNNDNVDLYLEVTNVS